MQHTTQDYCLTNQILWGLSPWIVLRVGQGPGNWSQGQTKAGLKQPAVVLQDQKINPFFQKNGKIGLTQFVWMKNWIIYLLYSWQALLIQFFIHTSWANPISVEIGLSHPSTRKGGR